MVLDARVHASYGSIPSLVVGFLDDIRKPLEHYGSELARHS